MCTKVPYPNRWLARRVAEEAATRQAERDPARSTPASRTTPAAWHVTSKKTETW